MKFLNNIDLQKNEIQNFRVQNLAAAPSNPVAGQHYFNTVDNTEYVFNGTEWVNALSQGNYVFEGGITEGADRKVTLDKASKDAIGGVVVGDNIDVADGVISVKSGDKTQAGLVAIATDEEATAGVEDTKAVTAKQVKTGLDLKADKTALAETDAKVAKNAEDIALKAAQSDLDAAVERIAANETAIGTKAAQTDLDAAVTRISANETQIAANKAAHEANAAAIALKADKTTVETLTEEVAKKANAEDVTNALALKADKTELEATNAEVAKKAAQTDLDATNARVTALEEKDTNIDEALALKADKTALEATDAKVKANEEAIAANADAIATKAEKTYVDEELAKKVDANEAITAGQFTKVTVDEKGLVTGGTTLEATDIPDLSATYINVAQKGAANGVATLDANGLVPAAQLPSYVDDVIDLLAVGEAPATANAGDKYFNSTDNKVYTYVDGAWADAKDPEADKIYVNLTNNMAYRWSGTTMVQIGADKLLGFNGQIIGDGATTEFTINHNLGTRNVVFEIYEAATPYEKVYVQVLHNSLTELKVIFSQAPEVGVDYNVTIIAIG